MSVHEHDDECLRALTNLHLFLHHELDEATEDEIRHHLDACEACLEQFDVETVITQLLRRCHPPAAAPSSLRMRVMKVSVTLQEPPYCI